MRTIWQDLRYSARLLRKHPGFTLTAVGVLTLGIGVNAGIFGIINGLMIRPLAGADAPGEVVGVFSKDRTAARDYRAFSYPGFSDVRDAGGSFAHLAGHTVALAGVTENNTTRPVTVDIVTTGFFETLGVQPVYGRDFTMEEEHPGTPARSVIVSYKVWEQSGLDRAILKRTARINGQEFAIVGVAPQHFTGTTAILGADYYLPIGVHDAIASDYDADGRFPISDRRSRPLILVGRLKPRVTRDQADAQLKVIATAHEQAYPDDNKNQDLVVGTLDRLDISTRPQEHEGLDADGDPTGTSGDGAADVVHESREHDVGVRIGASERDRDPSGHRRHAIEHRASTACAGLDAVARRRRAWVVDGDMGSAGARVVDGVGIPDLSRARSHTRYYGAPGDDDLLFARDDRLRTLAGAAIVPA